MSLLLLDKSLLMPLLLILSIYFAIVPWVNARPSCVETHVAVEYFMNKTSLNYWKWMEPEDTLTNVTVAMQINRVDFYNDVESTFDIQVLFELEWLDERLRYLGTECNNTGAADFVIEGNEWHYSLIWSPNLRVAPNKKPNVLNSKEISQVMFVRIESTGHIRVRMRTNVNLFCPMDYRKYPFDSQICRISIVSNDLPSDKLLLLWSDQEQIIVNKDLYMSSHSLEKATLSSGVDIVRDEQFSMLSVDIHLKRHWGHYMLVIFFPSMLIVATSWLSFWVEITSPPARITLCVTTLLALVTASKQGEQDLPKVPYIKATDFWFAGCTVSIFLSLIEYIIVAYTFRAESKKRKAKKRMKRSLSSVSLSSTDTQTTFAKLDSSSLLTPMESDRFGRRASTSCIHRNSLPTPQQLPPRIHFTFSPPESPNIPATSTSEVDLAQLLKDTPQEVATSIDRKSRIMFPFMFILFNLIYWSYYN